MGSLQSTIPNKVITLKIPTNLSDQLQFQIYLTFCKCPNTYEQKYRIYDNNIDKNDVKVRQGSFLEAYEWHIRDTSTIGSDCHGDICI